MARYILCETCNARTAQFANEHQEYFESIKGEAIQKLHCDGGFCPDQNPKPIEIGETCFAVLVLPSKSHLNYSFQKPEVWAQPLMSFVEPQEQHKMTVSQLITNLQTLQKSFGDLPVDIAIESMDKNVLITGKGTILNIAASMVTCDAHTITITHKTEIPQY